MIYTLICYKIGFTLICYKIKISTNENFEMSYIYNENRTTFGTFSLVTSPTLVPSE